MEMTIDKCIDIVEDVVAYMASYGSAFPNEVYANHSYSEICYAIRMLEKSADKADYENRLKDDKVAMLEDLKSEIEEKPMYYDPLDISDLIQEKINSLKEAKDG